MNENQNMSAGAQPEADKVDVGHDDVPPSRAHVDGEVAHVGPGAVETARHLQKLPASSLLLRGLENDPEIVELTIAAVKSGLRANQMFYDKHEKKWAAEPDARTRLAAAQLVIHNLCGLPLQRIESKSMTVDATPQAMETMLESPAVREALKRKLAAAEAKAVKAVAAATV